LLFFVCSAVGKWEKLFTTAANVQEICSARRSGIVASNSSDHIT